MKSKLIILVIFCSFVFVSCSKSNDAGIQIDGNGRQAPRMQSASSSIVKKDTTNLSDYGIAIDPNGRN